MEDDDKEVVIAQNFEAIDYLFDVLEARGLDEAVTLSTMLHEISKLFVAGLMPKPSTYYAPTNSAQGFLYAGDELRKALTLHRHLNTTQEVDDDGIPMGMCSVSERNGTQA